MDIKPRSFKKPILRPKRTQGDEKPLAVPEELLESGKPTPLIPAHTPRRGRKKWWILAGVVAFVLAVATAVVVGLWWYSNALQPRSAQHQRIRVVIEQGATPEQIADELQKKEVIQSSLALQLLMRQRGERDKLQAGAYLFSPTQPAGEILDWLVEGKVDTFNVTILPGQSLKKIKEKLIKDGFAAADIDAAFVKKYDHPLLTSKPNGVNLEGYIYPDTYQISSDTTVEQLLMRSFDEFNSKIEARALRPKLAGRGFNLHQGVTMASLVQLEVSSGADRRQVAQVFEKRYKENMALGSDVTFIYAAELLGQPESVNIDSPYNTRRYPGLPPGAVSNFTIDSLVAVAEPAAGDYLYFVAGDDGTTHFARTEAEHQQNIDRYCTTLCGR